MAPKEPNKKLWQWFHEKMPWKVSVGNPAVVSPAMDMITDEGYVESLDPSLGAVELWGASMSWYDVCVSVSGRGAGSCEVQTWRFLGVGSGEGSKGSEAELSLEEQDEKPSLRETEDLEIRYIKGLEEPEWHQRQGGIGNNNNTGCGVLELDRTHSQEPSVTFSRILWASC